MTLLLLSVLATMNMVLIMMLAWICYKRKDKNYLPKILLLQITYIFVIQKNSTQFNIGLSIFLIILLLVIIKSYSNRINKEYNDSVLASMKNDYKKFSKK